MNVRNIDEICLYSFLMFQVNLSPIFQLGELLLMFLLKRRSLTIEGLIVANAKAEGDSRRRNRCK